VVVNLTTKYPLLRKSFNFVSADLDAVSLIFTANVVSASEQKVDFKLGLSAFEAIT